MEQDETNNNEELLQFELSEAQKAAIDKELELIDTNPNYLLSWEEVRQRFKKPQ